MKPCLISWGSKSAFLLEVNRAREKQSEAVFTGRLARNRIPQACRPPTFGAHSKLSFLCSWEVEEAQERAERKTQEQGSLCVQVGTGKSEPSPGEV